MHKTIRTSMDFFGQVNDTYFWNDYNSSHEFTDLWNSTSVDQEFEDSNADQWIYNNVVTGICLAAIATNIALLILTVGRAYQYRATDKWKWARLHFIVALCVDHILLMTYTVATNVPEGQTWFAQSDGRCTFWTTFFNVLQLAVLPYVVVVSIHIFFQVYHPAALVGVWQFVACLVIHPIVWIAALVSAYVTSGRYTKSLTYGKIENMICIVDDPNMFGNWLYLLTTLLFLLILSYLAFITTVGTCLVKPGHSTEVAGLVKPDQSTEATQLGGPTTTIGTCLVKPDQRIVKADQSTEATKTVKPNQSTDATMQDDGQLRWMIKSRAKACVFLVVITVVALATHVPVQWFTITYLILDGTHGYNDGAIRCHFIVLALNDVFYLLFPLCCLILQEMGVYSMVKQIQN